MWGQLVGSVLGGSSGGSGGSLMYSGQNESSVYTPIDTTQGGIGAQVFNIGGNPNVQTAFQSVAKNPWPWALAAAAVVFFLLRGRK